MAYTPESNPLRLHDLRVRRLAEALSHGGRLRYTPGQFAARSQRRWRLTSQPPIESRPAVVPPTGAGAGTRSDATGEGCVVAIIIGFGAYLLFLMNELGPAGAWGLLGGALVVGVVWTISVLHDRVTRARRHRRSTAAPAGPRQPAPPGPPVRRRLANPYPGGYAAFLRPWGEVYGGLPPHMVRPEDWPPFVTWLARPPGVAAVVCDDHEVLACLAANGVPERLDVTLLADPATVPDQVPIVLLHDAEVESCLAAAGLHARHRAPVVTAALLPRQVAAARRLPRHRSGTIPDDRLGRLTHLTPEERAWLRHGWTPLLELSPRQLVGAVERAVLRVHPAAAGARTVGFLDGPDGPV
jgi:hypothetical protein